MSNKTSTAETIVPRVNSESQRQLDKATDHLNKFTENVAELVEKRMNFDPSRSVNATPQTNLSSSEIQKSKDIYLKPARAIGSKEIFNDKFRSSYEFDKQYVQFIAENKELIGSDIEIWTKPYPGMPAEYWIIPVNKPVYGPRYLAEQLKRKFYHRLKSDEKRSTGDNTYGGDMGMIVVDTTVQRLDANPVSQRKSIFMGSTTF